MALLARRRLRYYHTEEGYDLFQNLECSENRFIQSLIELMQFENDDLQISSYKLLFAIFQAEKFLFVKAKSSYFYTFSSFSTHSWMIGLATFFDPDKILLRMLQGDAESGEESYLHTVP